jgi:hypothetical protein
MVDNVSYLKLNDRRKATEKAIVDCIKVATSAKQDVTGSKVRLPRREWWYLPFKFPQTKNSFIVIVVVYVDGVRPCL